MDEQERLWVEHTRDVNARGICEFSGYEFKRCARTVCDCGFEELADEQIDAEVAKIVAATRKLVEAEPSTLVCAICGKPVEENPEGEGVLHVDWLGPDHPATLALPEQ